MQTTVRITSTAHALLKELARRSDSSMQVVLERAIEDYRRKRFLDDVNLGYARLRRDADAWSRHEQELAMWDATLADGLDGTLRAAKVRTPSRARKARTR